MDKNKNNNDRNRMLEEILNQTNQQQNNSYKRNTTQQHIPESIQKNSNNEIQNEKYIEYSIDISKNMNSENIDSNNISTQFTDKNYEEKNTRTAISNQQKIPNRPNIKKRSARLPMVLMLTTLIFTVAICLSVLIIAVGRDMLAIGKDESLKMVTITEGANAKTVAKILADEEIIQIPKAFEIIAKISGADTDFIPGEYELSPSDAYETIITKLTTDISEYKETVNITFVEGISIFEAAQKLEEEGVCNAERFIYYFNAGGYGFDFEDKLPSSSATKFYRMEGYLFPDTYTFYVDSDPESVCMKIYQNFDNKITEKYYSQMNKLGMTLDEVITLASIVQAEASSNESMKMVASVFENRLADPDNFPKLESDPTTYYVDEIIKPNIEIPSDSIFEAYDTYQGNGLPPGAIGNPGLDAIEAVLYPADTDYYFFYANIDTKEIYYAKTNEEHEENKRIVQEQQEANSDEDE